jgi:hypothetical protein
LYWDTGDKESKTTIRPYHYVRLQKIEKKSDLHDIANNTDNELKPRVKDNNTDNDENYEILIVGGEDHKTGTKMTLKKDMLVLKVGQNNSFLLKMYCINGQDRLWNLSIHLLS